MNFESQATEPELDSNHRRMMIQSQRRQGWTQPQYGSIFDRTLKGPDIASLAQLVEQRTLNPRVQGSSPWGGISKSTRRSGIRSRVLFSFHEHQRSSSAGLWSLDQKLVLVRVVGDGIRT
jgi:hypothetical protein